MTTISPKNSDWIKLHRSLNNNELWLLETFSKGQAWVDLIMNANWKPGVMSVRGTIIEIDRGQIGWSEMTMAKRWKWSRDKVRRFLSYLERTGKIRQLKNHVTSIITICNYEPYQSQATPINTCGDTTEKQQTIQQTIHDIRREEGKELTGITSAEEPEPKVSELDEQVIKVINHLNKVTGRRFQPGSKEAGKIRARLRDKYSVEQCIDVINLKSADDWFIRNPKYMSPSTLFAESNFERYVNDDSIGLFASVDIPKWRDFEKEDMQTFYINHTRPAGVNETDDFDSAARKIDQYLQKGGGVQWLPKTA